MGRKKRERKAKVSERKVNITDSDSRILKGRQGFVQGYNAQAVVSRDQVILAADVVQEGNDLRQLIPMVRKAQARSHLRGARG